MKKIIVLVLFSLATNEVKAQYFFKLSEIQTLADAKSFGYVNNFLISKGYKQIKKTTEKTHTNYIYVIPISSNRNHVVQLGFSQKMKSCSFDFSFFSIDMAKAYKNEVVTKKYIRQFINEEMKNIAIYADKDFKWMITIRADNIENGSDEVQYSIAMILADEMDDYTNDNN